MLHPLIRDPRTGNVQVLESREDARESFHCSIRQRVLRQRKPLDTREWADTIEAVDLVVREVERGQLGVRAESGEGRARHAPIVNGQLLQSPVLDRYRRVLSPAHWSGFALGCALIAELRAEVRELLMTALAPAS